uniref:Transposase n=1 Tax=Steinernema glaseri TaxID=37863 RepID=A0A1I7ZKA1_9BILA
MRRPQRVPGGSGVQRREHIDVCEHGRRIRVPLQGRILRTPRRTPRMPRHQRVRAGGAALRPQRTVP